MIYGIKSPTRPSTGPPLPLRYALLVALAAACAPKAPPPLRVESERLQGLGDHCRAADAARSWTQEDPHSAAAWVQYAHGATHCGRRDEAMMALARAAKLSAGPADDVAAELYLHLGEAKLSLRASDRYLSRRGGDVWHYLRRALAALAAGEEEELRAARDKALELSGRPGCKGVREGLRLNRAGAVAVRLPDGLKMPARLAAQRAYACANDEGSRGDAESVLGILGEKPETR